MKPRVALLTAVLAGCCTLPAAAQWGPEERLTDNTTVAETGLNHGALAVDSQGNLTAAWAEQDGPNGNFQIYTRTKSGGTWAPAQTAVAYLSEYAGTGLGAKFPALAFTPEDSLVMVWHDYRIDGIQNAELFTKIRGPQSNWGDASTETRLTTSAHPETGGDNSYMPNVATDPEGNLHVAWYDYRFDGDNGEILFKSRLGGAWDLTPGDPPDTNLSQNPGESHFPALAAGPDGRLHLAWRDNSGGAFRIVYRTRSPGGSWSAADTLSPPAYAAAGVDLAAAPDGRLVAVWSDARFGSQTLFLKERSAAGVWGADRQVSPAGVGAEEGAVVVDALLQCHVVWQDARVSPFSRQVFYQSRPLGAPWDSTGSSDTRLSLGSGSSTRPTLLLTPSNRLCVLWQDTRHQAVEIYFREQATATGVPGEPAAMRLAPRVNPFRSGVSWNLAGSDGEGVTARVFDVRGRLVRGLPDFGAHPAWNGLDHRGLPAAPGVYVVEFRREGRRVATGKVVKLP